MSTTGFGSVVIGLQECHLQYIDYPKLPKQSESSLSASLRGEAVATVRSVMEGPSLVYLLTYQPKYIGYLAALGSMRRSDRSVKLSSLTNA